MARNFKDLCFGLKLSLTFLYDWAGSIEEYYKELGEIRIKHNDKAIDVIDNFGTSDKEGYEEYMNMDSTIAIIRGILEVLMGEDILNVAKDLRFHDITLDDMKTILVINEDGTFDKEKSFLNARNIIEVMGEFI